MCKRAFQEMAALDGHVKREHCDIPNLSLVVSDGHSCYLCSNVDYTFRFHAQFLSVAKLSEQRNIEIYM